MVAMVVSQELDRVWSFNSHWRCSPFFIRFEILTNFVEKYKEFFFTKDLVYKAKSDRLTRWVFTVLLSRNNSFASKAFLVIGDVHLALFALTSL